MVHVLSCHQFAGDPKVLTPSQEPLAIFASPTQMFVATLQHSINVYSLVGGLSDGHGSLQHSFTTAGLVKQGVYCTTGNYIAALEVRGGSHQVTTIRIYFNWETSGPQNAVRARVAGGEMQTCERGATIATSSHDQDYPRQSKQFELVEVQTPTPAQCISCCPATGNLAAGINNTVSLYRFVTNHPGLLSECQDFEYLMQIQVGLVVRDVAFCEGTIACLGSHEVQVFKIRLWDTGAGKLTPGRSVTEIESCNVSKSNGSKRRVPLLIKHVNSSQDPDPSLHPEAHPEKLWTSSTYLTKTDSPKSQPYFVIDEGAGCGWDFGIEAVTVASSSTASASQKSNQDCGDWGSASVLFPTIQSEEPYSEKSVENCEIIGPIGRIQGHPVHITMTNKKQLEKMKSSLSQLLYRQFIMVNFSEVESDDDSSSLHSLQLLPTYASGSDSSTEPSTDMMESHNAHNLAGLSCFFSTSKQGFLYEMQPRPRLLTEYTYKADAVQVQAGYSLLFALTQNGLETYTLHTLAAALLNMEPVDNIQNTCPPATLDVSLVGLEPYLGLTQLAVSNDHVMLLSRTRDSTNSPTCTPKKSEMGASICSKSNTMYIHEKSAPTAVFKSLMELGERYQHSSPAAYLQCMLEGHLLLRTAMTLGRQSNASQGTVSEYGDCEAASDLHSLYLQSCLQLALHYCRGETPNWHLTLPYFNMSELPLPKIIECSPKPYTAFEDKELMTGAGLGMIHYLDWVIFDDSSTLHADQVTADMILKYFVSLGPQHCSQVVLFSKIAHQLSPDKTLSVLMKVKDTHQPGHHVNFVGCPQSYTWCNLDRLAMCEVYLRLGDLEQAGSTLCTLSAEEITQLCTQHSALLLQAEDQFSNLAQLIRQQEPESLLIALVQLIDENTVSLQTCIKLLKDEKEPLSAPANSHLKRFLEELVFTNHRHDVLHGATITFSSCGEITRPGLEFGELLFAVYFERMEKGMSKGVPLRHSSRHTHIFSGGGCYSKRPEWLDFLAPFQGTEALTFKCFQQAAVVVPSMPRRARSYSDRSQIPILGKFGGGQRSSGSDQSRQSTLTATGADGKEEDVVCPCCCCNEDLLAIQSLITSPCATPTMARQVQQLTGIALGTAPTTTQGLIQSLQSLHIVCLAVLDPPAALELLIQDHPGIVLDYAQDSFGKDTIKWKELLKMLLDRGADFDAVSEGSNNETRIATKGHTDFLQVLTGVLGHASNLLTPEELLQCLPSEGSLSFFLPYLRQSGCRQNARLLHQQLVHTLAS